MTASYSINQEHSGIEITFGGKPAANIREALKASGFRWHKVKGLWYAKSTPARLELAKKIASGEETPAGIAPEEKPAAGNKYGVVVGDVFSASWGYDQTNVDFFQVVELVGASSVRVVEVYPEIVKSTGVSWASEDRTYKIDRAPMRRADYSVFIKDQERGDLKRLKSYAADGVSNPLFVLSSFADATLCTPGECTEYVSWYA